MPGGGRVPKPLVRVARPQLLPLRVLQWQGPYRTLCSSQAGMHICEGIHCFLSREGSRRPVAIGCLSGDSHHFLSLLEKETVQHWKWKNYCSLMVVGIGLDTPEVNIKSLRISHLSCGRVLTCTRVQHTIRPSANIYTERARGRDAQLRACPRFTCTKVGLCIHRRGAYTTHPA